MPKNEFSPDDPYEMIQNGFDATPEEFDNMATCVIEELMFMGYNDEMIIAMFRSPFYQLPHSILKTKGEKYLISKIEQVTKKWGLNPVKSNESQETVEPGIPDNKINKEVV